MEPVRWGILSTARIGVWKFIPGMRKSSLCRVDAIASRDLNRAREAADQLQIPKAYGSYEELLADPGIQAIYNPLPNHLHVPLTIQAARAGKHVLCEKPLALNAREAESLLQVRDETGVLIQEAFMVRHHPQWLRAREIVRSGRIGKLRAVQAAFSYFNDNPGDIRNQVEIGGGGIYDIGCYPVVVSRFLFEAEPTRVVALIDRDPQLKTDRLASAILEFPSGQASFVCSTQLVPYQRVQILGTKGRVGIEIPFNAPPDKPCRLYVDDGAELGDASAISEMLAVADQYGAIAEDFARAAGSGVPLAYPLEDAVRNMRVIDALYRSGASGAWEEVQPG